MDRPFTEEGGTAHKPSESPIIPDPPRVPKQPTSSTRRLKYVSWNAGGLHASRNRELKAWLQQPEGQQVHLVAVQETHWQGPLEYSTDRFHAVHSGGHKSEAGVLLLVDRHTFSAASIQHRELLPGRLLHVRLEAEPSIDVIVGYQYAWSMSKQQAKAEAREALLAKRSEFWAALAACIQALPRRNQILLLADLNTDTVPDGSLVGNGVYQRKTTHAPDSPALQDLLRQHQLVVLNSWGKRGRAACTFLSAGEAGHSQIDFAIARQHLLDPTSKQVGPQPLPFVPVEGLRHLPLAGSIVYPTVPRGPKPAHCISRRQVQAICQAHPAALEDYQNTLTSLHSDRPDYSATELITHAWQAVALRWSAPPAAAQPNTLDQPIQTVWTLRRQVRLARTQRRRGLPVLLRLWRSVVRLKQAQRILQARSRQAKKQRIHDLLWEASQSQSGVTSVFRLLKVLAPAAPRRKLQLRHKDGRPLGTSEAMTVIKDYFHNLYNLPVHPDNTPNLEPPDTPTQLTLSELQHAIGSIPASKALPVKEAPSLLWRAGATVLADKLLRSVNGWMQTCCVPHPRSGI